MSESDINVRLKLLGAERFQKDAAGSSRSVERLGKAGDRAGRGAKGLDKFARSAGKMQSAGRALSRNVTLPLLAVGAAAVKTAVDWESAFAGVRKTVDATEGQYAQLDRGLREMSKTIPTSAIELASIAEAAGQLGIKRPAILGFTRTIADLGEATNLTGEEGAAMVARFANITQMPQGQFDRLGSSIVALGNAGASTEKDIVAMGLRLAGAGSFVGMSEHQILSFANALSSVGIEAEAGGTAMSTTFKKINSAVADGGKDLQGFAQVAGMSAGAFRKSWEKDAAGASVSFVEGLGRLRKEGKNVPAVLDDLGLAGIRVQDTLLRASGAGKLLRESLDLGKKSWMDNMALTEEARERYKTLASQAKIMRNRLVDIGITIGSELLPPLNRLLKSATNVLGPMVTGFGKLPGPVKAGAVAFVALLAAVGPVTWAIGGTIRGLLGMKSALGGMKGVFAKVFRRAGILGGMEASTSVATTTATQTPKKLSRKHSTFAKAGRTTGTTIGTSMGTSASTVAANGMAGTGPAGAGGGVAGKTKSKFSSANFKNKMRGAGKLAGGALAIGLLTAFSDEIGKGLSGGAITDLLAPLSPRGYSQSLSEKEGRAIYQNKLRKGEDVGTLRQVAPRTHTPQPHNRPGGRVGASSRRVAPLARIGANVGDRPIEITVNHQSHLDGREIERSTSKHRADQQARR